MTAAPTVAGVVLNHDYGRYVRDAVESLLAQQPPLAEVVVVDDGSTDDSLALLAPYRERVRLIVKPNGGQWSACRAALDVLQSDYVYFLDADDVAGAGLSAALVEGLATRPVKLQFPLAAVDADLRPLDSVFPTFPAGYDAARMRRDTVRDGFCVCPPTSGNVFSVQALRGLDLDAVPDREFVDGAPALVLPFVGEIVSLGEPHATYRVHGENHSLAGADPAAVLRKECARFRARWQQAHRLLPGIPCHVPRPTYLLERELLLAALGQGGPLGPAVGRYVARLPAAPAPLLHRVALGLWALLLLLPSRAWRQRLVQVRRSAVGRPRLARVAVAALVRATRTAR